jgi:ankyrin repeat protein
VTDPDAIALAHRMFDLAREGSDELLTYLDSGVPVGLTDAAGSTLVMLAAYHDHASLVVGLATRGADMNALNDRGQTPLAGAVEKNRRSRFRFGRPTVPAQICRTGNG